MNLAWGVHEEHVGEMAASEAEFRLLQDNPGPLGTCMTNSCLHPSFPTNKDRDWSSPASELSAQRHPNSHCLWFS